MASTNDFDPLNVREKDVFDTLARQLSELPNPSQFKVLKELALRKNRELVKPGALLAARAIAFSRAKTQDGDGNETSAKRKSKKSASKKDPEYVNFVNTDPMAVKLKSTQCVLQEKITNSQSDEEKTSLINDLRKTSTALRGRWDEFRAQRASEKV
jgi:hypothetical protein